MEIFGVLVPGAVIAALYFWIRDSGVPKVQRKIEEQKKLAQVKAEQAQKEEEVRKRIVKSTYTHQWQIVDELIKKHSGVLVEKRNRMMLVDDYGVNDSTKWNKEKEYFISRVLIPSMDDHALPMNSEQLSNRIDQIIDI